MRSGEGVLLTVPRHFATIAASFMSVIANFQNGQKIYIRSIFVPWTTDENGTSFTSLVTASLGILILGVRDGSGILRARAPSVEARREENGRDIERDIVQ